MSPITYALSAWFGFITLVYLYMWYDSKEHNFNIVGTLTNLKETFMQDE